MQHPTTTPSESRGLGNLVFALLVAIGLALTIGFPLYQALVTGGFIAYANGTDEPTYLLHEFSRAAQSITRSGQYLVTLGHQAGLSGGWINMIFDAAVWLALPLLVRAGMRRAGWSPAQANAGALLVMTLPQVMTHTNPLVAWLDAWNVQSGAIYWLNTPSIQTSPFWRTPEPQWSWLLLATGALAGLRWRSFWPVYAVLPFLYPFVSIPAAFVTLACHLHARWPVTRAATTGPLAVAFLMIAGGCLAYYQLLVPQATRQLVVASHLPLISFTGLVGAVLYLALRQGIAERERFVVLALALAPWVACNQQLISGYVPQPDNFEAYAGSIAVALMVAVAVRQRPWLRRTALAVGLVVFAYAGITMARIERAYHMSIPWSPELVAALRTDPGHAVINYMYLSSLLDLTHPRQAPTALSFGTTFGVTSAAHIEAYRCLKRQVLAEHPGDASLAIAFSALDTAYAYGGQNYVKSHIHRRVLIQPRHDVSQGVCQDPRPISLKYFWAR